MRGMVRLRLYTRPGCGLCDEMRREVDELLGETPREWELIDVDSDPDLTRRNGESVPLLFVNDRLVAQTRIPKLAATLRLHRAAGIG